MASRKKVRRYSLSHLGKLSVRLLLLLLLPPAERAAPEAWVAYMRLNLSTGAQSFPPTRKDTCSDSTLFHKIRND